MRSNMTLTVRFFTDTLVDGKGAREGEQMSEATLDLVGDAMRVETALFPRFAVKLAALMDKAE